MGNNTSIKHETTTTGTSSSSSNTTGTGLDVSSDNQHLQVNVNFKNSGSSGMIRSASGADIGERTTQLVPIEKLSQILKDKSHTKYGVNGVVKDVFVTQVFPVFPDLGQRLFKFLHQNSKAQTDHLGTVAFRQQCERFLGLLDDSVILENFIKMYADDDRPDLIHKNGVMNLLLTCFKVAMSHYSGNQKFCPYTERTLLSVCKSIFFSQDALSIGFVSRWFEQNCIRLVLLVHKYCVHTLSTAYRGLEQNDNTSLPLELSTPVLEQTNPFPDAGTASAAITSDNNDNSNSNSSSSNSSINSSSTLMPLSQAWLLAGALPPLYSKPQTISPPKGTTNSSTSVGIFREKLSMIPSHWTLLYDSNQHGVGANRFLHHVLGYRGPTLILLNTKDGQTYCIAAPSEWKETHLYTGGEGSCVIQLMPKFVILEKRANILYLNTSIRGYPKGLRAASDPRKPILSVDEYFEKIDCKGIASELSSIEVWGCGDKVSREVQLDIKKWQIKEAERQRTVKLTTADWMDHPDRYLLELGGRTNYNN